MGIAMALMAAGLAYVVVKKMTNKKRKQGQIQYGAPPGGSYGGFPGGGGGGYRDMLNSFSGGGGGFGAPPPPYGAPSAGGAAASFFGGGGGGGTGKRDLGGPGGSYGPGDSGYGGGAAYGAPAGGYGGGAPYGAPQGPSYQTILNTLNHCIQEQRIGAFYRDPRAVDAIAQRIVANESIQEISEEWNLTPDIAVDLCKLALFDIVVLCDDSAAMRGEQNGERINDLKETLAKVAFAATLFDDDGIEVRFLNAPIDGNRINSDDAAVDLLSRIHYDGPCQLGAALDYKVLQPLVVGPARANALHKPKLIIIITGGTGALQAEAPGTLQQVISRAAQELSYTVGADAMSFQFCQVGNDMQAAQWLGHIDEDPSIGGLIDQTGDYDLEAAEMMRKTGQQLTPVMWLLKMMLGGIDNAYDAKDE